MTINYNSVSAKIYRYFYTTETMPTNLCPYFWKSLIATILIIPYYIITIPTKVLGIGGEISDAKDHIISSSAFWFFVFSIVSMIFGIVTIILGINYDGATQPFLAFIQEFGIGGVLALGLIIIVSLLNGAREWYREYKWEKRNANRSRTPKEPKLNIFVEFVKAKYNNYCPQITWDKAEKS